ncbi:hypothetical protein [Flindersiella endophytica]
MNTWYTATEEPELTEFGTVHGLGITGQGAPGAAAHMESTGLLYAVAGPLLGLAAATSTAGSPFSMPPLEGRWWVEDDRPPFEVPREEWCWQLFLRLPDDLPAALFDQAREVARAERPGAARVQLVSFTEGSVVQALHVGPFAEEPKTLARMDALITAKGLGVRGLHDEIYLTDFSRTDPAELRTILRQPVG